MKTWIAIVIDTEIKKMIIRIFSVFPSSFSINLRFFYHKCHSLIRYATRYLFL